ncbi:cyclin-dependent protein kinase inhibitor SMR3 [Coffea eugenioides]|uniref:cyclin-dependent protein kinase inhibitor SMR3 n=1 Tax=Coffea eugenioides TaxID=49369 RepID=UPI000F60DA1F|nr:cyclin-dependent protein kinase inhibitor SMR3 [Coffea eugenioides]
MCPDFHTHSSLGMSGPQYFVLKEDEEGGEGEGGEEKESKSKIESKDTSRNSDGLEEVAPKNISSSIPENPLEEKKEFDADDDDDDKVDKCGETSVSSTESEKPCPLSVGASTAEVADDDEGFRTPTSPSHKIPVITQCPPAPKKTTQKSNPASIKRKGSPTATRRALHLDLSSEVESMFPPLIQDDDADGKTKKARRDHDHNSAE